MPRARTTKGLAKRIELTYYKALHPFRRWWRILCIVGVSLGALWLLSMAVFGDQRIYTSGQVVVAHRMFEADCERCHAEVPRPGPAPSTPAAAPVAGAPAKPAPARHTGGFFFRRVSDGACLTCHDGSVHHETQTHEAGCATCHTEHEGKDTLTRFTDRHCTSCHADLKTKTGAPQFERQVTSLAQHPEFTLFRKNVKDEAQIKLSHATHLKEGLPAGGGKRVTLGCVSCHVEDAAGKYILPISYAKHCAECHPLEAGPDLVVPHDRPEIIRGFLLVRLGGRPAPGAAAPAGAAPVAGKPGVPGVEEEPKGTGGRKRGGPSGLLEWARPRLASLRGSGESAPATDEPPPPIMLAQRQRGGATEAPAAPAEGEAAGSGGGRRRSGTEGPAQPGDKAAPAAPGGGAPGAGAAAIAQAEKELFTGRSGCKYCHTVEEGDRGLPKIVPTKIPARWLPHSAFDHRVHRPLACASCHAGALKSTETSDVLMPKMQSCRECHRDAGGARTGCVECHLYHDRAKERRPDGAYTIPQFLSGR